jgi:hypothetical protein
MTSRLVVMACHVRSAGEDIARDVANTATEVIMSAKTWMKEEFAVERGSFGERKNMSRRPWPQALCSDGSVIFEDDSVVADVDVVMFCTGVLYPSTSMEDFWLTCHL